MIFSILNYYWASSKFIEGEEINDIGTVVKSKTNYIIVKLNNTKFYIQSRDNNFIVDIKVNISGTINNVVSNVNYYQFDFKEYLAQNFIRYEIKTTAINEINHFNLRVAIYKILNLQTAPELVKILFLNNYESSDLL